MDFNNKELMKRINKQLGVMCLLLVPFCVGFGIFGIGTCNHPDYWNSVSATFYANSNIFMIGLLFATSLLFFSYQGYDKIDRAITDISGAAALGVIMFPCKSGTYDAYVGLFQLPVELSNIFHCTSASILFSSFALMIGWRFTLSSGYKVSPKKALRNKIYYICCGVICFFMSSQIITSLLEISWFTIINEFFILVAFGIAWLVKGEAFKILND